MEQSQSRKVYTTAISKDTKTPDQKAVRLLDGNTNPNIIKLDILVGTKVNKGTNSISTYMRINVKAKVINKKPTPSEGKEIILSMGREKKYKAAKPKINK